MPSCEKLQKTKKKVTVTRIPPSPVRKFRVLVPKHILYRIGGMTPFDLVFSFFSCLELATWGLLSFSALVLFLVQLRLPFGCQRDATTNRDSFTDCFCKSQDSIIIMLLIEVGKLR